MGHPVRVTRAAPAAAPSVPPSSGMQMLSLPEQIAAQLATRITTGSYAPGLRIMEQALAADFGVSRGPVREALRLLEKDGLVTILARRGAQVTKLSIQEVREIFDIRVALNGLRDRGIAEDPERLKLLPLLEAEVAELSRLARNARHSNEYVECVVRLNRALTAASRSARLRAILDALARQTLRYSRLGLASELRRRQSVKHWQELVKAVREGDGERAQRAAEARVRASRDEAIKKLRELAENL
jgi:DNA-binding GntR family transcriptional regulator